MRLRCILGFLFLVLSSAPLFGQGAYNLPPVKYEEYRLKNGLRVILHRDNSTPVVAVNVWYHVGSKNEVPGKTGLAHLFEHLMFQGSKNYSGNFHTPIDEAGASRKNGITTSDTTNYFETVPANFLELALFMEADRMGGLLDELTQEKLDIQRDVVKNERRENFDNRPYGTWREKVYAELYPEAHPYRWHTIGSMTDLSGVTLDDVKAFFRKYYVPNNAILSVAGDFDPTLTKQWIAKYFGSIPKGASIARPAFPEVKLKGEIRRTVEDSVNAPRSYIVWHGVRKYHPDEAALEMLIRIVNIGRSSRLFGKLVFEKQLAQSVGLFQENKEGAGLLFITVLPGAKGSLDVIENAVDQELERIQTVPPSPEEMARALNNIESQKMSDLQSVLVTGDMLGEYALYLNQPNYFQGDLDRYRKVTPADVQRVARTYLTPNRLILTYVPRKTPVASNPEQAKSGPPKQRAIDAELIAKQTANLPKPGPNPKLALPAVEKVKLSNGLEVWLSRKQKLPIVHLNMAIKSGVVPEPEEKSGVFSLTVSSLRSGTKTRSADDISNQLQALGTSVDSYLGMDWTEVTMQVLSRNLEPALDIFADVIVNPIFPENEIESLRNRVTNRMSQQKSEPGIVADLNFLRLLYGDSPYGRPLNGTESDVKKISRADVVEFHRANYRPNNSVLIVVGDFDKDRLLSRLEKVFGDWKPQDVVGAAVPKAGSVTDSSIFLIDRPGSSQSTIRVGYKGAARNSDDYFSMQILTSLLGWGTQSRISANLRESKGYAYEAGSTFTYYRHAGHFTVWTNVQTSKTKESLEELIKELLGIRGEIPVTEKELNHHKQKLIRGFPANFEEVASISFQLANLSIFGLRDSFLDDFIPGIEEVSSADVNRVANKFLTPDKMVIVIVGDRKVIESGLKELGYPIKFIDADGNPTR